MCIRDSIESVPSWEVLDNPIAVGANVYFSYSAIAGKIDSCLLYTSDAADERSSVDLGGRRIIKKKTQIT